MADKDKTQSAVDRIEELQAQQAEAKKMSKAEWETWKQALLLLCADDNFIHFLKGMVAFSGLYTDDITQTNQLKLFEDRGRKQFYLKYVRPFLDKKTKAAIE